MRRGDPAGRPARSASEQQSRSTSSATPTGLDREILTAIIHTGKDAMNDDTSAFPRPLRPPHERRVAGADRDVHPSARRPERDNAGCTAPAGGGRLRIAGATSPRSPEEPSARSPAAALSGVAASRRRRRCSPQPAPCRSDSSLCASMSAARVTVSSTASGTCCARVNLMQEIAKLAEQVCAAPDGTRADAAIVARRTRAGHRFSRGGRSAHGRSASEGVGTGRQVPCSREYTRADDKSR